MVWASAIENRVSDLDQLLFVLVDESAGERMVLDFDDDALAEPLPELGLSGPKLFLITTDDERRMLLFFLPFFLFHRGISFSVERGIPWLAQR